MTGAGDADPGAGTAADPDVDPESVDAGTPGRAPAPRTAADGAGDASKGGAP
jgi:hypothetical protein